MLRSTLSKGIIPPHHSLRKCYRKTDHFFLQSASKLVGDLAEAVANLQSIPELQRPDLALLHGIDGKPGSFGKAAANESIVAHCNILLTSWRGVIMETLTHRRVISAEVGPSITHPFENSKWITWEALSCMSQRKDRTCLGLCHFAVVKAASLCIWYWTEAAGGSEYALWPLDMGCHTIDNCSELVPSWSIIELVCVL